MPERPLFIPTPKQQIRIEQLIWDGYLELIEPFRGGNCALGLTEKGLAVLCAEAERIPENPGARNPSSRPTIEKAAEARVAQVMITKRILQLGSR